MRAPASVRLAMLDWLHELVTYTPQVAHTFLALKTIEGLQRRERAAQRRRAGQATLKASTRLGSAQLSRGLE